MVVPSLVPYVYKLMLVCSFLELLWHGLVVRNMSLYFQYSHSAGDSKGVSLSVVLLTFCADLSSKNRDFKVYRILTLTSYEENSCCMIAIDTEIFLRCE